MDFGRAGAFDRGGLSGRGSLKASPLVERWIWVCCTRSPPQCLRNHCFDPSPIGALDHLVIRCRLCRQIQVWLGLHPAIHLRITTFIPQRCWDIPQPMAGLEQALRKLLHPLGVFCSQRPGIGEARAMPSKKWHAASTTGSLWASKKPLKDSRQSWPRPTPTRWPTGSVRHR